LNAIFNYLEKNVKGKNDMDIHSIKVSMAGGKNLICKHVEGNLFLRYRTEIVPFQCYDRYTESM
jgi:hypothetical protein